MKVGFKCIDFIYGTGFFRSFCAFIDFTKAFDYINRDNLWSKLIQLGLRGNILDIIRSMYNSVKSQVKYLNELSDSFNCTLGVRQGESLSPFLFAMFLNDLEDVYVKSGLSGIDVNMFKMFLILYADDIVIFSNTAEELQRSLDLLKEYCITWKLVVNTNKTKIMVFRKGGQLPNNLAFFYDGQNIEIVSRFVYLGIAFTTGGSFKDTQTTLAGQALKAIFKMEKYLYKFTDISIRHRLELFDKLILPILNYGSEVWGFHKGEAFGRIHLKFGKRILCVKTSTQNDFIYGELGRMPLQNIRFYIIIKYWLKILHTDENKFIKKVYTLLCQDTLDNRNIINWCSSLRNLLCNLGFYDAWLFQGVGNVDIFLSNVKLRLKDQYIQNWTSNINESSRALFYRNICNHSFQPYLDIITFKKYRINLTRLRVSSHRLCIETGRWTKPNRTPVNERLCTLCNKLEDEFHFIIE